MPAPAASKVAGPGGRAWQRSQRHVQHLRATGPDQPAPLRRWHAAVEPEGPALLDDLLADDVTFRFPAV